MKKIIFLIVLYVVVKMENIYKTLFCVNNIL